MRIKLKKRLLVINVLDGNSKSVEAGCLTDTSQEACLLTVTYHLQLPAAV